MNTNAKWITIIFGAVIVLVAALNGVSAKEVPLMTKEELKKAMSEGSVLVLDARQGRDWSSSEFKIKGAVRVDPAKVNDWSENYAKNSQIVVYCA
jgi:hypothetical protein